MKTVVLLLGLALCCIPAAFAQCANDFLETREIMLDQSTQPMGNVQRAAVLGDGSLVVTTDDPGIVLFEGNGTYVRHVGGVGRGPFEYRRPSTVRATDNGFAVWDRGNSKVMTFASDGTPRDEWTGLRSAANLAMHRDTLVLYHTGGRTEDFIAVHTREAPNRPVRAVGKAPGEHIALTILEGSAPLAFDRSSGHIYYASPAAPTVYRLNPATGTSDHWTLRDPAFDVGPLSAYTRMEDVNSDLGGAIEQAVQSSRFLELQVVDGSVLSLIQHGAYRTDRSFQLQTGERGGFSFDTGDVVENTLHLRAHWTAAQEPSGVCQRIDFDFEKEQLHVAGLSARGFLLYTPRFTETDVEYIITSYAVPE